MSEHQWVEGLMMATRMRMRMRMRMRRRRMMIRNDN
jgi:hypothetical protein